jgi:hypothetical protein
VQADEYDNEGGHLKMEAEGRTRPLYRTRSSGAGEYDNGGHLPPGPLTVRNDSRKAVSVRPGALTADADGSHLSGAMIALIPTEEDAARLAIEGGEAAGELHLTLIYLGKGKDFKDSVRQRITDTTATWIRSLPPADAVLFGAAHWNGGSDEPSWVWSAGDLREDDGPDRPSLSKYHAMASAAAEDATLGEPDAPELPEPHTPWVAHVCAAYSDDPELLPELESRLGPVTFDRVRVTFGGDSTDIPLTAALVASGHTGFRRKPTAVELASKADFALTDARWHSAVDAAVMLWTSVLNKQRMQLRQQIAAAVNKGDLARLADLSVDTADAYAVLFEHMQRYAQQCGEHQEEEARKQGVTVGPWSVGLTGQAVTASAASRAIDRLRDFARVKVSAMADRLRSAASSRAVVLAQQGGSSGDDVANAVDREFTDTKQRYIRDDLAASMSAAQNIGRAAVLYAAPPGRYYASELLDKNTCKPCAGIDGREFSSLDAAEQAYPAGGYVSCQGGGRCRGELVTVWDPFEQDDTTASAVLQTGETVTTSADPTTLGGKPSEGTKKDKRLKDNKTQADADHFGSTSGSVSDASWDGAASRFTDQQYRQSSAACDSGQGTAKELCFLPHHEPDGTTNRNGVHAAAQRVGSLSGHDPAAVARAKAHLRSHYSAMGEEPPDSLKATLADAVELALEEKNAALADTAAGEAVQQPGAAWRGPLAIEGKVTGDGREFADGALTWPDDIQPGEVPLRWNKEDSHGGDPHTVAVNVGRIDRIWRDNGLIMGEGVFNLKVPDGQTAYDMVKDGFLRGISIDADSISDADVEYVWPEDTDSGEDDGDDLFAMLFAQPEKIIFHGGRIRGATLCDIPAFVEAYIELTDNEGAVVASAAPEAGQVKTYDPPRLARAVDGIAASGGPRAEDWRPPAAWFADPKLSVPTGITVDDDGRVYGHAAMWGSCHIGQTDVCVQPPHEEAHPYYMTGEVLSREGGRIPVGQITVGTGHAPLSYGAVPASEHYDHTGHAVADVAVGNDAHGIWVAGSIRPNADPLLVHELRASGQVSGDWRRIGSALRLVGLLAVNVPGFPVPRMKARVASGQPEALVAAGRPTVAHGKTSEEIVQLGLKALMGVLSGQVHGQE